jgi:hypothetical protein
MTKIKSFKEEWTRWLKQRISRKNEQNDSRKKIKGLGLKTSRKNEQSDKDEKLSKGTNKTRNVILWAYEHDGIYFQASFDDMDEIC